MLFRTVLSVLMALVAGSLPLTAAAGAGVRRRRGTPAARRRWCCPTSGSATFLGGIDGRTLLLGGLLVCALGLAFGLVIYKQLKNMPVHRSMLEVSELIYETCKTYLLTQGRFLLILWVFIGVAVAVYFGKLATTIDPVSGAEVHGFPLGRVADHPAVQPRSAWPAATRWPGSASGSTPSPTPARRSRASAASRIRAIRFRSGRA